MTDHSDKPQVPTNTTEAALFNPFGMILGLVSPDQEIKPQADELEHCDVLPVKILAGFDGCGQSRNGKTMLEDTGVCFLGGVPGDRLFQQVRFPEHLRLIANPNNGYQTFLIDLRAGRGGCRGVVCYNSQFWDRSASLILNKKYEYRIIGSGYDNPCGAHIVMNVLDINNQPADAVIHHIEPIDDPDYLSRRRKLEKLCCDWLNQNYPDWENRGAYWK